MQPCWDIFCRVVDNWGDIGVCWRFACELATRGTRVRLWVDDAGALAWMAPRGHAGVQVLPWPESVPADGVGDVVVETFGCDVPPVFATAMAVRSGSGRHPPVWINLEYLSAESYVARSHGLPSPVMNGPGAGLVCWYFYPGFTQETGGLLHEADLQQRQARFDRTAWRIRHGIGGMESAISLFCYEPAALPGWLDQLAQRSRTHLLVTPGRSNAAVHAWLAQSPNSGSDTSLSIRWLQPCSQPAFDELLWASDFNCVRGEDSLVRALWAGKPLLWHIYPQHDNAHHAKLDAFLDWLDAPSSLRALHHIWNGMQPGRLPDILDEPLMQEWTDCIQTARTRLLSQDDLVTQLFCFVKEKS